MPAQTSQSDTDPDAARAQIELLRTASPTRRLQLALSLSATATGLARRALARAHPGLDARELGLLFVRHHYGADLEREVRRYLSERDR